MVNGLGFAANDERQGVQQSKGPEEVASKPVLLDLAGDAMEAGLDQLFGPRSAPCKELHGVNIPGL